MKTSTTIRNLAAGAALAAVAGIAPATTAGAAPAVRPSTASTAGSVAKPWEKLPATPRPVAGSTSGYAKVNGIKLYYSQIGKGSPVILLHGGPANSNYFGHQVNALKSTHRVIVVDTRGHGRSTTDGKPLGYDLFADDVVDMMTQLKIAKADFVGWSDGGVTALDIAMRYPERTNKVVAFGANTNTNGVLAAPDKKPAFGQFVTRAEAEYTQLSPTPKGFTALNEALGQMYSTQPNWTNAQLRTIKAKVLIMDGDHDEAISQRHTRYIAKTIPGATLRILKNTSHFAFLQDPKVFNTAITRFLG